MKIIRSSKCSIKFATNRKKMELNAILTEYGKVVNLFIDHDSTFGMRRLHPDDDFGDRYFRVRFADKWEGIRLVGMAE